jgi:predicted DNA-binding transcriptional regulator AlpA
MHTDNVTEYVPLVTSPLLTTRQAAAILGISPRTLEGWRNDPTRQQPFVGAPPCVRLGCGTHRVVRYRLGDLESWIAQQVTV